MLILIFSLAVTAAIFWEIAEFLADQFLGMNTQLNLRDTIRDLFMGALGGFTMAVYYCRLQGNTKGKALDGGEP